MFVSSFLKLRPETSYSWEFNLQMVSHFSLPCNNRMGILYSYEIILLTKHKDMHKTPGNHIPMIIILILGTNTFLFEHMNAI